MAVITGGHIIEGSGRGYTSSGAPSAGTTAVQTLTIGGTPTSGTFTITFDGFTTAAITWSSTNGTLVSNIDTALEALPNIGTGGITTAVGTMTAGIGTITLTFAGNNVVRPQNTMVATSSLVGTAPTAAITSTTPGVAPSGQGAAPGALLLRADTNVLYINTGTALAPTWTVVGAQT